MTLQREPLGEKKACKCFSIQCLLSFTFAFHSKFSNSETFI